MSFLSLRACGSVGCADALDFSAFADFYFRLIEFYCLFASVVANIFFFGLSARPSNGSCAGLVASLLLLASFFGSKFALSIYATTFRLRSVCVADLQASMTSVSDSLVLALR